MLTRYEVRLAGQPDEESAAAFAGLDMTCNAEVTVISGTWTRPPCTARLSESGSWAWT